MEFDEMKKIWDSQKNEPIYAIDEQTLHRRVIRKSMRIKRMVDLFEWGMLTVTLFLALFMMSKGLLDNEIHKFPQCILFLIVAGYIYWGRRKRLQNEGLSDKTLLGDLDQAILRIDYQIKRQRNFLWWFLMPAVIAILINLPYTYEGKPWWVWTLLVIAFSFSYWIVDKELRCKIIPKKRNLESLRSLLVGPEA